MYNRPCAYILCIHAYIFCINEMNNCSLAALMVHWHIKNRICGSVIEGEGREIGWRLQSLTAWPITGKCVFRVLPPPPCALTVESQLLSQKTKVRELIINDEGQKSANSLAHFSADEMWRGSSSYVSKLLWSPGPLDFGINGASVCNNQQLQKLKHQLIGQFNQLQ